MPLRIAGAGPSGWEVDRVVCRIPAPQASSWHKVRDASLCACGCRAGGRISVMNRSVMFFLWLAGAIAASAGLPISIDFVSDGYRPASGSMEWNHWSITNDPVSRYSVADLKFTLRAGASSDPQLRYGMLDESPEDSAPLACDGVYAMGGEGTAALELVIEGLQPGPHLFRSFHNSPWRDSSGPYRVSLKNNPEVCARIVPSRKAMRDVDVAKACLRFKVGEDRRPVIIRMESEDINLLGRVILNGFQLEQVTDREASDHPQTADPSG